MKLLIDARNVSTSTPGWMNIQGLNSGVVESVDNGVIIKTRRRWIKPDLTIDEEAVRASARDYPEGKVALFEIETFAPSDPKLIDLVDIWRSDNPSTRLGFYRLLPSRNYWAPIAVKWGDLSQQRAWEIENSLSSRTRGADGQYNHRGLSDTVDYLAPSLYNMYPDWMGSYKGDDHSDLWFSHYAPAQIEMARRFGKQIYPYLWFRYHDYRANLEAVSIDLFRRQIQWCLDNADGVFIWGWDHHDRIKGDNMFPKISELLSEFVQL